MCTLIIDHRERYVTRHAKELENTKHIMKQLTVGDYAVIPPPTTTLPQILATIERKSLTDYAASIKDGRHDNKQKLINLRAATGCKIVYIIEGPEFPAPNECFGNIPYKHIESSIFHLMIRDSVTIIRTKDSLDTALTLARFVASMDTLCEKLISGHDVISEDSEQVDSGENISVANIDLMLTQKHEMTDHDVVRGMWSQVGGISVESASDYMNMSIADLLFGRIDVTGIVFANGKRPNKKVVGNLRTMDKTLCIRMLSVIPGISRATATAILAQHTLRTILSWNADGIEMIIINDMNKRRVGPAMAEKIMKFFNYKYVASPNPTPEPTLTNEELNQFLDEL